MRASGAPSASTVARVIASASGTSRVGPLVPVAELLDRVGGQRRAVQAAACRDGAASAAPA